MISSGADSMAGGGGGAAAGAAFTTGNDHRVVSVSFSGKCAMVGGNCVNSRLVDAMFVFRLVVYSL